MFVLYDRCHQLSKTAPLKRLNRLVKTQLKSNRLSLERISKWRKYTFQQPMDFRIWLDPFSNSAMLWEWWISSWMNWNKFSPTREHLSPWRSQQVNMSKWSKYDWKYEIMRKLIFRSFLFPYSKVKPIYIYLENALKW